MFPRTSFSRRRLSGLLAVAAALALHLPLPARAADFPDRPLRLIVPNSGGVTDALARFLATQLGEQFGQPVVVDVRAGAGGLIGYRATARAAPDGYTLLLGGSTLAVGAAVSPTDDFDPERDLTPIAKVLTVPFVLLVNGQSKYHTLQDLLADARARPLKYNSVGVGSGPHLAGELLRTSGKLQLRHIPYNGGAAQITSLLSQETDFGFMSLVTALPQISSGTLRALAVSSAQRAASLPDVPALAEGVPAIPEINTWFALFGPARLPAARRDRLERETLAAVASPLFDKQRKEWGAEPEQVGHEALGRLLAADRARWTRVVKEANIRGQ